MLASFSIIANLATENVNEIHFIHVTFWWCALGLQWSIIKEIPDIIPCLVAHIVCGRNARSRGEPSLHKGKNKSGRKGTDF